MNTGFGANYGFSSSETLCSECSPNMDYNEQNKKFIEKRTQEDLAILTGIKDPEKLKAYMEKHRARIKTN